MVSTKPVGVHTLDGRAHLFTGGGDGTVRVWDAASGAERGTLGRHTAAISVVCAFVLDGRTHLVAGGGRSLRIWDAATGAERAVLEGHTGSINAACVFTLDGRVHLATGGADLTVRIWDPVTAAAVLDVPTRDPVLALAHVGGLLAVGTEGGLFTIRLTQGAGGSGPPGP